MTNKIKKTHLPLLVDTPLTNSTEFLTAFSAFKSNISDMIDYLTLYSVGSINNSNKQIHDPVNNQAMFYKNLNDGELPIKENTRGVRNSGHGSGITEQLPEKTGLNDVARNNTEFLVYWIEKYRVTHDVVKGILHETDMLPKENSDGTYNIDNIFFNDFSESMFSLKSTTLRNPSRECLPVWDVKCTTIKEMGGKHTVPNQYTGTSDFNVHKNVQQLANIMSRKNTCMFRNNMKNIVDCVSLDQRVEDLETAKLTQKVVKITTSDQPHGANLMHDSGHTKRMWQNAEPLARITLETLSNMSYVLDYMDKNLQNNLEAWGRFRTDAQIEKTVQQIDLLHDILEITLEEVPATAKNTQSVLG